MKVNVYIYWESCPEGVMSLGYGCSVLMTTGAKILCDAYTALRDLQASTSVSGVLLALEFEINFQGSS